jgi:hypothetical protein
MVITTDHGARNYCKDWDSGRLVVLSHDRLLRADGWETLA